ncbi:MAG: NAD(P)H-dependent flavin oxidoreductase [Dongiaceae bacterium]
MWPDRRIIDLFGIEHPIVLAPMAGPSTAELAIAVAEAGGLGSLACAMSSLEQIRKDLGVIRQRTAKPINLNFFVHTPPQADADREARWKARLAAYYAELGVDPGQPVPSVNRAPFSEATCEVVEEFRPEIASFHFGLPEPRLLTRVKAAGCKVIASATTAAEAKWLAERGCDAVIAQGCEAGGHRGMFLTSDIASQAGTFALVPQVADAVGVPVIAAGGIADARGIVAALALGASAVQIGTAYLFCPEANVTALHREALKNGRDDGTALTNLFTGRPARGLINRLMREVGPIAPEAPAFPLAGGALAPLKAAAEAKGSADFSSLWSGQAAALGREMPAGELTQRLAREALARLGRGTQA